MSDEPSEWEKTIDQLFDPNDVSRFLAQSPEAFIETLAHEFRREGLQQDEAIANMQFKGLPENPLPAETRIPVKDILAYLITSANIIERLVQTSIAYAQARSKNASDP
jgi:hypothetical protein